MYRCCFLRSVPRNRRRQRWFNGLEQAIVSLSYSPHRCPFAPESAPRRVIRQLLYGRKPHIYRVLYSLKEGRKTMFVLHIRHGAKARSW
jgi:toxin ParE1/3/4